MQGYGIGGFGNGGNGGGGYLSPGGYTDDLPLPSSPQPRSPLPSTEAAESKPVAGGMVMPREGTGSPTEGRGESSPPTKGLEMTPQMSFGSILLGGKRGGREGFEEEVGGEKRVEEDY